MSSDVYSFFFFNDTATTEIYTLSLHDALPIFAHNLAANHFRNRSRKPQTPIDDTTVLSALHTTEDLVEGRDRKSTRLNSSHANISYAVFCLKKRHLRSLPATTSPRSHRPLYGC